MESGLIEVVASVGAEVIEEVAEEAWEVTVEALEVVMAPEEALEDLRTLVTTEEVLLVPAAKAHLVTDLPEVPTVAFSRFVCSCFFLFQANFYLFRPCLRPKWPPTLDFCLPTQD